ncbi:MAG: hypothetical protein U1C51_03775 [Candidatus Izemoplasmatales bacterium]|nr:hypothetical protein [Candidatus Izemoplasmatales bacterium]
MGVQKITFDGANVTSKIDADLYHFLFSSDVGILRNVKSGCSYTLANNTITFLDGYVGIYGRIIYVENMTTVSVTPDSNKFGYVVLGIDTQANTVSIYIKEAVGTYPVLTQNNLQNADGLYEFALAAYSKTTTSVTLIIGFERSMITSDKQRISDLEAKVNDRFYPHKLLITKISNGVYRFGDVNSAILMESILYVVIENTTVVSLPTNQLFIVVGSNSSMSYRYAGSDYSLGISYASGLVTLSLGNTTHRVTQAYLKK